jgi:hypothetical protein
MLPQNANGTLNKARNTEATNQRFAAREDYERGRSE